MAKTFTTAAHTANAMTTASSGTSRPDARSPSRRAGRRRGGAGAADGLAGGEVWDIGRGALAIPATIARPIRWCNAHCGMPIIRERVARARPRIRRLVGVSRARSIHLRTLDHRPRAEFDTIAHA